MSNRKARALRRLAARRLRVLHTEREILPERVSREGRTVMVIPEAVRRLADKLEGK